VDRLRDLVGGDPLLEEPLELRFGRLFLLDELRAVRKVQRNPVAGPKAPAQQRRPDPIGELIELLVAPAPVPNDQRLLLGLPCPGLSNRISQCHEYSSRQRGGEQETNRRLRTDGLRPEDPNDGPELPVGLSVMA
jgi:hypothetical protein